MSELADKHDLLLAQGLDFNRKNMVYWSPERRIVVSAEAAQEWSLEQLESLCVADSPGDWKFYFITLPSPSAQFYLIAELTGRREPELLCGAVEDVIENRFDAIHSVIKAYAVRDNGERVDIHTYIMPVERGPEVWATMVDGLKLSRYYRKAEGAEVNFDPDFYGAVLYWRRRPEVISDECGRQCIHTRFGIFVPRRKEEEDEDN